MSTYLTNPITVRESSWMQENVDEDFIVPIIPDVELMKLVPIIGEDKYAELIAQTTTPPMTAANTELMTYITPMLNKYTLQKVAFALNNQITNTGVISKDNENGTSLSRVDMFRTSVGQFGMDGDFYAKRLVKYMCDNNIQVFNSRTFNTSIFFNGKNNNKTKIVS